MANVRPISLKPSIGTSFHLPQPELERCLERHGKRQTNLPKDVDWNLLSLLLRRFLRAYLTRSPLLGGIYLRQDPASTWTSPATPRQPCSPASTGDRLYPPSLADKAQFEAHARLEINPSQVRWVFYRSFEICDLAPAHLKPIVEILESRPYLERARRWMLASLGSSCRSCLGSRFGLLDISGTYIPHISM
jgi:hypothetical protein